MLDLISTTSSVVFITAKVASILVLRSIPLMRRLCTKVEFDYTFIEPLPIPTHNRMLVGSEEKIMCHTSARFHRIILIT